MSTYQCSTSIADKALLALKRHGRGGLAVAGVVENHINSSLAGLGDHQVEVSEVNASYGHLAETQWG